MNTDAPNFVNNYPLGGDRIGPSWVGMWEVLSETTWVDGPALAAQTAERGLILAATAKGLLKAAENAGILESRKVRRAGYRAWSNQYRVSQEWLAEHATGPTTSRTQS